jgi:hypothetical protein
VSVQKACSTSCSQEFLHDYADGNKLGVPHRNKLTPNVCLLDGGFDTFRDGTILLRHLRFAETATHKEANEQQQNKKKGGSADPIAGLI